MTAPETIEMSVKKTRKPSKKDAPSAVPEVAEAQASEIVPAEAAPFAVGQEVEFSYPFPTEESWVRGIITKIYGEKRAYNKDCQIKSGTAFYYRCWDKVRPMGSGDVQAEALATSADEDLPFPVSEAQIDAAAAQAQASQLRQMRDAWPVGARVQYDTFTGGTPSALEGLVEEHLFALAACMVVVPQPTGAPISTSVLYADLRLVALPGTPEAEQLRALIEGPLAGEGAEVSDVAPAPAFPIPTFEPVALGLRSLPLSEIRPSPLNPRKKFDEAALRELATSIYQEGLQQNLVVRPHPERHGLYEIAAGERRWRAMTLLATTGLNVGTEDAPHWLTWEKDHPVPVLVRNLTDLDLLRVATAENVQRRGFTRLEEADAFAAQMDLGATLDSLHEDSGLGKRTILRRVQIARNLIPELREMYESKKLTLEQVEVLAIGTAGAQQALLKNQLKYSAHTTPAQLRMLLQDRVFATSRAQFPRSWYTGKTTAADLFGELGEHFDDFDLAFGCQVRHVVELAKKDVSRGAAFSDVREQAEGTNITNFQYRSAADQPGGTVYWISTQSGELRRYENLLRNPNVNPATYQFEGAQPVATHETPAPQAAAPTPAAPSPATSPAAATSPSAAAPSPAAAAVPEASPAPQAVQPVYGLHSQHDRVALALAQAPRYAQAGLIYSFTYEAWDMLDTPEARAAVKQLLEGCSGLFSSRGGVHLELGSGGDGQYELRHVLPALLALPDEVLTTLHDAYVAGCISTSISLQGVAMLSTLVPGAGFVLDEKYLRTCNHGALLELWADAGLAPESNASNDYLRAMLLEEAPALAARGWLPRPLAADVELEARQAEAQALIYSLDEDQVDALLLELEANDQGVTDFEDRRQLLMQEMQVMEHEELGAWAALWKHRAAAD